MAQPADLASRVTTLEADMASIKSGIDEIKAALTANRPSQANQIGWAAVVLALVAAIAGPIGFVYARDIADLRTLSSQNYRDLDERLQREMRLMNTAVSDEGVRTRDELLQRMVKNEAVIGRLQENQDWRFKMESEALHGLVIDKTVGAKP